ncbi:MULTISPECIES: hypothetical protein [unclassified Corynebacterium]|uniref:hypothetical protein n=1 Tax=Corynebacterium TaxID=1716 RepID=UPI00254A42AD|nr:MULTISPECIES: hypothetical protein [unclassified Corynebacterium]MDK8476233.1 hypothetical protein [Corynebacterium sp. MSK310]MDK8672590.1 hypothetical protein [Corynebacterium sp. MSK189]MDK8702469.1 hypothetical protein [Corynebacterium sp. MSK107]MDK8704526.1 hypothetical protein [Corynebacterium sp. MSK090]MDK8735767.1 hypothetical protein [Corynebacterium sp. MSK306]
MNQNKPLPEEIYKRRRVAALIIVIVLAVVLIWAAVAAFGGDSDDSVAASSESSAATTSAETTSESATTSTDSTSESESASESEAKDGEEGASESKEPEESVHAAKDTCSLEDLEVRTSMLNYSVPDGELPKFFMTVTNPTAADCKIDLDENSLRFEVYKMTDNQRVWSDTDCYASVQTGEQTFPAGKDLKFEAEWSRQASEPGKCTDRPTAEPGAYFAHTVIGDNSSPPQDFTLR